MELQENARHTASLTQVLSDAFITRVFHFHAGLLVLQTFLVGFTWSFSQNSCFSSKCAPSLMKPSWIAPLLSHPRQHEGYLPSWYSRVQSLLCDTISETRW